MSEQGRLFFLQSHRLLKYCTQNSSLLAFLKWKALFPWQLVRSLSKCYPFLLSVPPFLSQSLSNSLLFILCHCWSEKAMAPHSSTLAWKIPWTEEPGGLQSMGSWRFGHDWATSLSLFTFMHWRRKWHPTPVFLPGESQGRGSLVGCRLMGSHRVGHNWSDLAAVGIS